MTSKLRIQLLPYISILIAGFCITFPARKFFIPKIPEKTPWLFEALANWGERQANLAWNRGSPELKPEGYLNIEKYKSERQLAVNAAKLRPVANFQLASTWYRFALALNNKNIANWRLAAFLAHLSGDVKTARRYLHEAMAYFPNQPLLLLERSYLLGDYEHPRIHLEWAQEAYIAFQSIPNKEILSKQDLRMFFMEYMRAIRRTDRKFDQPQNRKLVIQLYQELAKYDPEALTRSPVYKSLIEKEQSVSNMKN
jgi:hypothetical protein